VQAERRSRVVTVLADAGLGKTRLAAELLSTLGDDATSLVGRCVSYGEGATYLPLAAIFRQAFPTRPEQAIKALIGDENAGLIAQHLSQLSGQGGSSASTGELFWAVRRVFEALALERPLVVVLEDVHWAEPTLLDLVEYLDAWTVHAPLLIVCLARPELVEGRPGWGSPGTTLSLEPLGQTDAEALVGELAGELDAPARARIVEIAEGNPLFLEQLLAFAEEAGPGALESVPPSVDALLASRLEGLEPEDRALLERAAVAGREFSRAAVTQLSPPEELAAIDARLTKLIRRGFVSAPRDPYEETLRFYHPLVREVAYTAITKESRADLHARYGAWLERREENAEEIVGYHLEQAHRYRAELRPSDPMLPALAKGAGDRLSTAGIRAWKRADLSATVNLLGRAASLLPPDDSGRAEMLCELGIARLWGGDSSGGDAALSEALAVALDSGDRRMELRARIELAREALLADRDADPTALLRLINDAIPVLEEFGDDRALGRAWRHAGYVSGAFQGRCAEWIAGEERALVHYKRSGWSAAGCLSELGTALLHGPTPVPVAVERCERLLDEATDRTGTANVLVSLAGLQALAERFDEGFSALDAGEAIYRELDEIYALADNSGRIRGRMHVLAGDPEAAEQVFLECCETFARFGNEAALSTVASELGQTLYSQARFADGWDWARRAESSAPANDIIAQFSWRSLKGKLLAHDGLIAEAAPLVAEAVAIVQGTDALSLHGDVLVDAAHVLRLGSRPAEAARRIEQALELFDRKANVASARAARSLLAELIAV
jgi:tetratricopeptide (TPR) repeat protein